MCYRISTLLNIPIPTLVKLLGLDLPAPPRVSLHGISADTITLHWSLPEKAGSVAKHIIQVNGINVGESEKRGETSVTVTGLNPDQRYNVRVIAANAQNFQAPGQLIRLRTRRKSQSSINGGAAVRSDPNEDAPSVHPVSEVPPSPQQQPRQQSHLHHHGPSKRTAKERRSSPAALEQNFLNGQPTAEDQHTIESLTGDLDNVRNEIMDIEAQLAHAEEEYRITESTLRAELDSLKEKKNEEDVVRQRIRSEQKSLEEAKRVAEAARSRTERALKAKEQDVKKMKDDMARWEAEKVVALEKVQELSSAAEESKENAITTEKELGDDIMEIQKIIGEMEEDIRQLVSDIKALEMQKERYKAEEEEEAQKIREEAEKERLWSERQRVLEMRYMTVYAQFQSAEMEFMRSREALLAYQGRRESGSGADNVAKKPKQRRNRNRKSRTQTISSPGNPYSSSDPRFSDSSLNGSNPFQQQLSPTFSNMSSGAFFNIANGAVTSPAELADMDAGPIMELTGGAPMSPTADALLPSNLFTFEDNPPSPNPSFAFADQLPPSNGTYDSLGFMAPQSPMSPESVSTSPRSSFNQIPFFPNMSGSLDPKPDTADHQSAMMSPIGSNRPGSSSTAANNENAPPNSNGRRFVRLLSNSFSMNRQRGKTMPFDTAGPLIGSLQAHSFPKNDAPIIGLDPIGTRRRSGSYGSWTTGLDFLNGKRELERTNSQRSATMNQFNPNFDPIDPNRLFENRPQPSSPRPSSISSFDQPFPAPSSDVSAAFGWPTTPASFPWADLRTGRISRSRPISPNAVINAVTNSSTPSLPRLNPTAPTFMPIEDDNSNYAISVASGVSLETVPTKESILSRFSLSRKGSTGKFNLAPPWKKDDAAKSVENMSGGSSGRHLWQPWRKADGAESGDEEIKEKEKEKEKGSFFGTIGRKKKEEESADEEGEKEKKSLGIWRRKEKRGKEEEAVTEEGAEA